VRIDRERYLTVDVAGDTFVLDERTGECFQLGGSGTRLWSLFAEGIAVEEAARVVADETHANYEQVLSDARRFIEQLSQLGIDLDAQSSEQ
jgi:hypothetical protein